MGGLLLSTVIQHKPFDIYIIPIDYTVGNIYIYIQLYIYIYTAIYIYIYDYMYIIILKKYSITVSNRHGPRSATYKHRSRINTLMQYGPKSTYIYDTHVGLSPLTLWCEQLF